MIKKSIIAILLLCAVTVSISGCSTKNAPNGTFGDRIISINNISIVNNVTAEHKEYNGTNYYYIRGYLKNNNKYDIFNLKLKATGYDEDGNVVAVNDTAYLNPKTLSLAEESFFYFRFNDPNKRIVRYELQIISASAEP